MMMNVTAAAATATSDVKLFITGDVTELTILLIGAPLIPSNAGASHHDSALKLVLSFTRIIQAISRFSFTVS